MSEGAANAEAKVAETAQAGTETGDAQEKAKVDEPQIPEEIKAWIEKKIQSETDRVRTKYSKELKERDAALETVKKEKMTAEEKIQYEAKKAADDLQAERRQVQLAKLELHAIKALQANDLGSELLSFVMADSEEAVDEKIKSLKGVLAKHRKLVADEVTKGNGRTVAQSPISGQALYTMEQMKAMSPADMSRIVSTPEGEKRIKDSIAAATRK